MLMVLQSHVDEVVATGVTGEDVLAMAQDGYRYDLLEGNLIRVSPAGFRHGLLAAELARRLGNFLADHPFAVVVGAETGFRLARNPDVVLGPDAAVVQTSRLPSSAEQAGFLELAPDLAVEIVSPSDRWQYVADKVEAYLAAGTRVVWVIEPPRRAVRVFTSNGAETRLRADAGDILDGAPVLPGFHLPLADLFAVA